MGVDLNGFDASRVEPNEPRGAVPKGDYQVIITGSEKAATKSGNGHLLNLELQIVEGEFRGRKLFDRLNLWNPSEVAQRIAQGTLSAICRAVNVLTPRSSEELHNRQLTASVDVDQHEGKPRNSVKGYKPRQSSMAAPVAGPVSPTGKAKPLG